MYSDPLGIPVHEFQNFLPHKGPHSFILLMWLHPTQILIWRMMWCCWLYWVGIFHSHSSFYPNSKLEYDYKYKIYVIQWISSEVSDLSLEAHEVVWVTQVVFNHLEEQQLSTSSFSVSFCMGHFCFRSMLWRSCCVKLHNNSLASCN